MTKPDDASLAIVKAVLSTAGELKADSEWDVLRDHFNKGLISKLAAMKTEVSVCVCVSISQFVC